MACFSKEKGYFLKKRACNTKGEGPRTKCGRGRASKIVKKWHVLFECPLAVTSLMDDPGLPSDPLFPTTVQRVLLRRSEPRQGSQNVEQIRQI